MSTNPIQVLKQTELLGHQFTVYGTAENPLFLAKEVGEVLEYSESNSSKLTNLVDDDEKVRNIVTTPVEIRKFGCLPRTDYMKSSCNPVNQLPSNSRRE